MAQKKAGETERHGDETSDFEATPREVPARLFKNAFEHGTGRYARKVRVTDTGAVVINLPKELSSKLHLSEMTLWKCEQGKDSKGDYLEATPLKEAAITRILKQFESSLRINIPKEMLLAAGLKTGDYVEWREEEGQLSLMKTARAGQYATKVGMAHGRTEVTIPITLALKLKLEAGMFGVWTFDEEKLWLEPTHKDPGIMTIVDSMAYLPYGARGFFKKGDIALLEVRDGKLYFRAME